MSSILKVDQIQLSNGNTPTAGDLGLNTLVCIMAMFMQRKTDVQSNQTIVTSQSLTHLSGCRITPHLFHLSLSFLITMNGGNLLIL